MLAAACVGHACCSHGPHTLTVQQHSSMGALSGHSRAASCRRTHPLHPPHLALPAALCPHFMSRPAFNANTTGGVHQGGAEEPQAGAAARAGGGQAHTVCTARHRAVPGDGQRHQRHCGLNNRSAAARPNSRHSGGSNTGVVHRQRRRRQCRSIHRPLEITAVEPAAAGWLQSQSKCDLGLTLFELAAAVPATCIRALVFASLHVPPCHDCCAITTTPQAATITCAS